MDPWKTPHRTLPEPAAGPIGLPPRAIPPRGTLSRTLVPLPQMRTLFVYLLTALIVGAALFFGYPELFLGSEAEANVRRKKTALPVIVAPVVEAPFVETLNALGTVLANESIQVTANRSDHVAKIHFEDGDKVEATQLLVSLQVDQETADLTEADARLRAGRKTLERTQDLFDKGISAQSDLDLADAEVKALASRVESLKASIADHEVRAPFKGRLGLRMVSKGAFVQPGTVLTTLDDLSVVKVDFTIPGVRLSEVAVGQSVRANADAVPDRVFPGLVTAVETRLDQRTRSARVRATIPNEGELLRPGMLVRVEVQRGEQPVLQVPEEAVEPIGNQQFVWVVDDENIVHRVEVDGGRRKVGSVEIRGGLTPGQRVVVEGLARVVDGDPVRVVREKKPDA